MHLRADFSERQVVRPEEYTWVASPAAGVERMMLDRIGEEVARATTIVRFTPNSQFDAHTHGGGEEYLVLEGVFQDEHGDYGAGRYVRNPIGTHHTPHIGPEGATILVKLHQFAPDDDTQLNVATETLTGSQKDGILRVPLHRHGTEVVSMLTFEPGARAAAHDHPQGEEIFVLGGTLDDEHGSYPAGTWIRNPPGSAHRPWSDAGCRLWMKTGHLPTN